MTAIYNETYVKSLLSANLKHFRSKAGMSQMDLAEKANVSQNCIAEIEGGKNFPMVKTLSALCNALEIDLYQLFISEFMIKNPETAYLYCLLEKLPDIVGESVKKHFDQIIRIENIMPEDEN
jgi:transcriptional regulator with XRE-family HTH domain